MNANGAAARPAPCLRRRADPEGRPVNVRVERRDGQIETLSLLGPIAVHRGDGMDHLHSADGIDHWFLHDGTYDGWSMVVPMAEPAADIIERVERARVIEPPRGPAAPGGPE